jgi:predicted metal-binding membrane protein
MDTGLAPLRRSHLVLLALLLALAGSAWLLLLLEYRGARATPMDPTMGMSVSLFLASWLVMIVAMMFPAATPMILAHFKLTRRQNPAGRAFRSTLLFMMGYLTVWGLSGIAVYLVAKEGELLAAHSNWLMGEASRLGGALLGFAGLYQLTAAKRICLTKCRHPKEDFQLETRRQGYIGSLSRGLRYGVACLGCCWLLCLILLPLGMLNVLIMMLLAAVMYAERTLAHGPVIGWLAGAGLVLFGGLVVFDPSLLPMVM